MKFLSLLLALMVLGGSVHAGDDATKYPGVKGSDQEIFQKLIGKWTGKEKGFRGTLVYEANGNCTSDLVPEDFFVKVIADPYSFTGRWEIKKGFLWSTVSQSSSKAIAIGTRYRNIILLLNEDTFVTQNERNMITTFKRVK